VNEQPADAIKREIFEETGLGLIDLRLVRVLVHGRHVEIIFWARPVGEAKVLTPEIYKLGWFDKDDLPEGATAAQKSLITKLLAAEFDNYSTEN
jgi:8-oxo-dGTP pyrophosphatase MutT (NUDIX family)